MMRPMKYLLADLLPKVFHGLTGDKRGLVTSVTKLNKCLGNRLPIAKLFAIANLGGEVRFFEEKNKRRLNISSELIFCALPDSIS